MKKNILFVVVLFTALQIVGTAGAVITVGRISHVEGEIFRFMDVDDSWVPTFLQSPVGTQDLLLTGDGSRAEIAFPNNQLMRLEQNAEIEILNLEDDSGEFSLQSGLARFYNNSSAGRMIVETARGTVKVEPDSSVDVLAKKESITISAVYGEATFHTFEDGIERMEVISGSTTLEFQGNSIVAGVGPLDRKWDQWCAEREGLLTQNRLVRSKHLPESMQEYAYVMEPYGQWQKIYYRGYYYWAWRPQAVPAGWSPYTTGYWYDWHGSEVWIDYNPWGWVTHHHGHWLNLHGAWLWTPYIHVAHVPGVTVIGLNITFGKRYRPHWHPGRVRWITYNDYIGWLPLAPWETYYGYRKWGPRTAVIQKGSIFSVNINLSNHRHIDHAVMIEKRYLHHRKTGTINNYKTVRVKNLDRMTTLKKYKPLRTVERLREIKPLRTVTRTGGRVERIERKSAGRTEKTRKLFRNEEYAGLKDRALLFQHNKQAERSIAVKHVKERGRRIERKDSPTPVVAGNKVRDRKKQGKVVRIEKKYPERIAAKSSEVRAIKRATVDDNGRKHFLKKSGSEKRNERVGQPETETAGRPTLRREHKAVAVRNKRVAEGNSKAPVKIFGMRGERRQNSVQKAPDGSRNYKDIENEEDSNPRQPVRGSLNIRERMASGEKDRDQKRFGKGR